MARSTGTVPECAFPDGTCELLGQERLLLWRPAAGARNWLVEGRENGGCEVGKERRERREGEERGRGDFLRLIIKPLSKECHRIPKTTIVTTASLGLIYTR